MTDSGPSAGLPLALVAGQADGSAGSMEDALASNGFAVLRTPTGQHAITRARTTNPDVIVMEAVLPDMSGLELCRTLREDPRISKSTPLLVTTPHLPTREQRIEALRAGAWECLGRGTDGTELVLKLRALMRAKLDADRARAEGLLDSSTGLYNRQGMARRAQELGSQAFREHGSLACVVLALDLETDAVAMGDAAAQTILRSVQALKSAGRLSDVVGRLGPTEFAVIAPATDPQGAVRLAERLVRAIRDSAASPQPRLPLRQVRVGYEAVTNVGYAPIQPADLLVRASAALRRGTAVAGSSWIRRYDEGTTPPSTGPGQP
ncbi:MAG TPA: response regulator [Gemmatimonadales bacterium]|nr:response regulator [Gemmatimonadales bacterium]